MVAGRFRVLVLGGYGNFGKRICESLAISHSIQLIIAGRNIEKATKLCSELKKSNPDITPEPAMLDIDDSNFNQNLKNLSPQLVIHTSGPFQGQDFHVPKACIATNAHYIDLADDRRFVCDITQLDEAATEAGVLLVSGASSVPGLSSAVVDHFLPQFKSLNQIDYAIAPGNKLERGFATIKAILSYTGHPFSAWIDGEWKQVYGWMDSEIQDFGTPIGNRHLANIDIPDLELFPKRYKPIQTVRFKAGLELGPMHSFMVFMAWLTKKGVINNWGPYTGIALTVSKLFYPFGTDIGGMMVEMKGKDLSDNPQSINWKLVAKDGVGPYIPILPAIIVANKLVDKSLTVTGAQPCLGLFNLEEFMAMAKTWGIYCIRSPISPTNIES